MSNYQRMLAGVVFLLVVTLGVLGITTTCCLERITMHMNDLVSDEGNEEHIRMIQVLKEGNESERMYAGKYLGEKRVRNAVMPLIDALSDRNQYVRGWAAWALGEIGDPSAVDPLIDALAKYSEIARTDYYDQETKCLPDIYVALEKLTNQKFELDVGKWQEWRAGSRKSR